MTALHDNDTVGAPPPLSGEGEGVTGGVWTPRAG